eukprot:TRINITY_DN1479_c0_g1_i2.p1 TRINITY_DN1479_c0_g1~~TRINITY_DN1479_c0_g1_i2.p1  ORF type:complete len:278 (-),score=25.26 TRINITY_DN1479_c0_g1_i2:30-863(-)
MCRRQGNATTLPPAIVGVANPFANSIVEFRLAAEPGDIVYTVLESGNTAIILTSKLSFDSPISRIGLHEVSFSPNGTITNYRRLSAQLPTGANVSLLQPTPCTSDDSFVYIRVGSGGIETLDLLALVINRVDGSVAKVALPAMLNGFSPVEEWYPSPSKGSLFVFLSTISIVDDEVVANATLWSWTLGSDPVPVALFLCPESTTTSFFAAPTQGTLDKTAQPWVYHRVITCTLNDPPTASAFLFSSPLIPSAEPAPPAVQGRQVPNDLSTSWGLALA